MQQRLVKCAIDINSQNVSDMSIGTYLSAQKGTISAQKGTLYHLKKVICLSAQKGTISAQKDTTFISPKRHQVYQPKSALYLSAQKGTMFISPKGHYVYQPKKTLGLSAHNGTMFISPKGHQVYQPKQALCLSAQKGTMFISSKGHQIYQPKRVIGLLSKRHYISPKEHSLATQNGTMLLAQMGIMSINSKGQYVSKMIHYGHECQPTRDTTTLRPLVIWLHDILRSLHTQGIMIIG